MNLGREGVVIAVGAVVALLLQIVVAPNIALFSAQPNFLLAYVLVVAIARPLDAGPVPVSYTHLTLPTNSRV